MPKLSLAANKASSVPIRREYAPLTRSRVLSIFSSGVLPGAYFNSLEKRTVSL
jgi:hypothetical protein